MKDKKPQKARSIESIALMMNNHSLKKNQNFNHAEIRELFSQTQEEISIVEEEEMLEISFGDIVKISKSEEAEALFSLVQELIKDINIEKEYIDAEELTSTKTHIEAKELKSVFKNFEKVFSANIFSLKNRKRTNNVDDIDIDVVDRGIKITDQTMPTLNKWIVSTLRNFIGVFFWSIFLFCAVVVLFENVYRVNLFQPWSWSQIETIVYIGIFLICFILATIIYPCIYFSLHQTMPGYSKTNLRLLSNKGYQIKNKDFFIRSLFVPLSILFFGYVPLFFKKRTLQDYIAGTVPIVIKEV